MNQVEVYSSRYAQEIIDGLNATLATGKNEEPLTLDQGIERWVQAARALQRSGGLIFFCGNGASCTMAEHLSHDWFQNAQVNTYTCSETSHITAISNDISYSEVFAYRIDRILNERDMLVTISSSGNSPNVIRAIEAARKRGATIITLSGKSPNNSSRKLGDVNFWVPLDTYGLVESAHAVLLHMALDLFLERYMGGRH